MASAPSTTSSEAPFRTAARILGVLNVLLSLTLAVLLAVALTELAHRSVGAGLSLLATVVAARWLLASTLSEWNNHTARSIRSRWRGRSVALLQAPRHEGERSRGDISLAIDQAADGPSLELLATSARVSVVGLALVFWSVGWQSTAITVGLMAIAVPLYQRAGTRSEALASEYQQRRSLLEARQLELLNHSPELRTLGAIDYGADEIAAISTSENTIAMRAIKVALESSLVTEFLSGVSIGLVAMVVGFALLDGRLSLLRALIAVFVTSDIFVSIRRFGSEFHRRENATKSMEVLVARARPRAARLRGPLLVTNDLLTEANERPVSMTVAPGDRVLITGPSGSGKTTLLHTLVGWRSPRRGSVQLADAPVGFVSVESSLLSGSLWDNLTLGQTLSKDSVRNLLGQLGLAGERFDDLDATLLADGRGLSGGERVRLALARCLLSDPHVLILDDIAGVMDHATRQAVQGLLLARSDIAIIEATVDSPLLSTPTQRLELPS